MSEPPQPYGLTIGQSVIAPLGKAAITARGDDGEFLVCYSRRNFSPEDWLRISPANGPCVFRMTSADLLKVIA